MPDEMLDRFMRKAYVLCPYPHNRDEHCNTCDQIARGLLETYKEAYAEVKAEVDRLFFLNTSST